MKKKVGKKTEKIVKKKPVAKKAVKKAAPKPKLPNLPAPGENPTQEQIDEMIVRLEEVHKIVIPKSFFGDDHLASIEAMIEVLRDDLTDDEIYQREEDGDWDENVANHARDARLWLDGDFEETDLADGWPLQK